MLENGPLQLGSVLYVSSKIHWTPGGDESGEEYPHGIVHGEVEFKTDMYSLDRGHPLLAERRASVWH
jgi:hypothetical protein